MIPSAGQRGWLGSPYLDLQLKPRDTAGIEAALCRAELQLDAARVLRVPIAVLCIQPGMPHVAKMHRAARLEALEWLAREGMVLNVARLFRVWRLTHHTLVEPALTSAVLAALPRCPDLQSLEVRDADLGAEDLANLCASHLGLLRLHGCSAVPHPGRWAGGGLAPRRRGNRLCSLVATGVDPGVIDAVTYLIHRLSLHTLKLNLGHRIRQVLDLLEALSGHIEMKRLDIRLDGLGPLLTFLEGMRVRRHDMSLRTLNVYCKALTSPLGASADERRQVSDLVDRLIKGRLRMTVSLRP